MAMINARRVVEESQMRWAFSTVGPTAAGLAISVALVVVSQSALVRTPWYQSALTVDTSFDSAMQALRRKILIDSFVVYPAAAIAAGGVVGLLSRRRARIAALIAALPVLVLAVAGAVGWVVPLVQVAAYGGLAWTVATFAHRWRHPEASQG